MIGQVLGWFADPANWTGAAGVPTRVLEHLLIAFSALIVAALIGLPIGLYIGHTGRYSTLAINTANVGRAVPSFALMVAILPISLALAPVLGYAPEVGLKLIPIFLAMLLLGIPPILVAAYAGLRAVDRDLIEAGRGMGMTGRQILRRVELPLSIAVIVGGFRTATLQVIATATIGAVLAYGGLGRFIVDGLARSEPERLFAGAILVALLALGVDAILTVVQRAVTPRALRQKAERSRAMTEAVDPLLEAPRET